MRLPILLAAALVCAAPTSAFAADLADRAVKLAERCLEADGDTIRVCVEQAELIDVLNRSADFYDAQTADKVLGGFAVICAGDEGCVDGQLAAMKWFAAEYEHFNKRQQLIFGACALDLGERHFDVAGTVECLDEHGGV